MRVYGRITQGIVNVLTQAGFSIGVQSGGSLGGLDQAAASSNGLTWVVVQTDANGNNDLVYVTALCQCLLLNLNESPFYATSGIPAKQAIQQQVSPDYYVTLTQQQYSQYFASLIVSRVSGNPPTYDVYILTHQGVSLNISVPIPT